MCLLANLDFFNETTAVGELKFYVERERERRALGQSARVGRYRHAPRTSVAMDVSHRKRPARTVSTTPPRVVGSEGPKSEVSHQVLLAHLETFLARMAPDPTSPSLIDDISVSGQ